MSPVKPFEPPPDEYEDQPDSEPEPRALDEKAADPTPSATDPQQFARATQKKKFAEKQIAEFWARVFADPIGRRAMWEILDAAHAFETRFATGPSGFPCPEATWFHAGEQAFGERLYHSFLRHDFEGVHLMLKEFHPDFVAPKPKPRRKPNDG